MWPLGDDDSCTGRRSGERQCSWRARRHYRCSASNLGPTSRRSPAVTGRGADVPVGHLFVVEGDIRLLACDAWLLPTDGQFHVSDAFGEAVGLRGGGVLTGRSWQGQRVQPFAPRQPDEPWVWLGDAGRSGKPASWFADVGVEFIETVAAHLHREGGFSRQLPLVALNVIGSGRGGLRSDRGDLHRRLIPAFSDAACKLHCDVVLVTRGRRAYSAAQRVRRRELEYANRDAWGALHLELADAARRMAAELRRGNLVLFFGAGISKGAGLPAWQELLRDLAASAGLDEHQQRRLGSFDLRDQATIIGRRLQHRDISLGEEISKRFASSRTSLNHAMLASLDIGEAVTTNFDVLYETAAAARAAPVAVLPYAPVEPGGRWLLKLHGSIDREDSITLTREDYLGVATRQGALFGLLQGLLLTRHMLFVGYSLSDDDFATVIHEVRAARGGAPSYGPLGTVITMFEDPLFSELWSSDLDVVAVSPALAAVADVRYPSGTVVDPATERRFQLFVDRLCFEAADMDLFLADPDYEDLLDDDERLLAGAVGELSHQLTLAGASPAWDRVRSLIAAFGGGRLSR